jgi:23S rRNA pseudouridine2605 synthase
MPRPHAPNSQAPTDETDGPLRLQKILASAGLGSRRQCEELILSGRVEVDRQVVTELGTKADPSRQEVRVDGVNLPKPRQVYFMVNKPTGVLSTNNDPSGRPRVIDLVPYTGRLFTVGRLDMSSEGLILVTNDGELADRLTHPRYGVEKTYQVEVAGSLDRKELEQLRKGVHLAEGFAKVVSARVMRQYRNSTLMEIVLAEGRNREIRRILARVGHKVERLRRVAIGPLRLAELPLGQTRELERDELKQLKRAARGLSTERKPTKRKPKKPFQPAKSGPPARTVIGGDTRPKSPRTDGKPRPAGGKPRSVVGGKPRGGTGAARPTGAAGKPRGKATGKPRVGAAAGKPRSTGSGRPRSTTAGGRSQRGGKPGARAGKPSQPKRGG